MPVLCLSSTFDVCVVIHFVIYVLDIELRCRTLLLIEYFTVYNNLQQNRSADKRHNILQINYTQWLTRKLTTNVCSY